jgi:hypothetical protein
MATFNSIRRIVAFSTFVDRASFFWKFLMFGFGAAFGFVFRGVARF